MELAGRLVLHCGIVVLCIIGVKSAECTKITEYNTLVALMRNDRCLSADKVFTMLNSVPVDHDCRADVINQLATHFQHQVETPAYCYCNSSTRREHTVHPDHHCEQNTAFKELFDEYFLNATFHKCRTHQYLWQVLSQIDHGGHHDCLAQLIDRIVNAFGHFIDPCRCDAAPVCHFDCGLHGRCHQGGCQCSPGYLGDKCEQVEACLKHPCHNGGQCMASDHGNFTCNCTSGYHGDLCERTHCSSFPCQNNASCVPLTSGTYYKCECPVGFSGVNCEVDHCSSSPCQHHHGQCVHSNNSKHYVCNCNHVYTGEHCEVDLCNGCGTHGSCTWSHVNNTVYCLCSPGYRGAHCEKVVDGCVHVHCQHEMQCNHKDNWPYFTCHCLNGYLGKHCEQTHCTHNPCRHGSCTPLTDGIFYRCNCRDGYSGVNCTVPPTTTSHSISTTSPTTIKATTAVHETTTPSLKFTYNCVKYTTVLDMAEKLVESNPMAINCTSGNPSSHEAFVLNNCGLPSPSTWKPGYNVMAFCNKIPTYTPIASFENGRYTSTESQSGIFLGCLHDGQDGFKIAIQRCDMEARIEYIAGTDHLYNRNPYNYFTLAV